MSSSRPRSLIRANHTSAVSILWLSSESAHLLFALFHSSTPTVLRRRLGKVPEGRVDVEDGDLEADVPPLERLDGGVQLPVEGFSVAVEPRHARLTAVAVQPDGRREAPQWWHGRDADPPRPQLIQLL